MKTLKQLRQEKFKKQADFARALEVSKLSQFRNGGGTHYSKRTYTLLAKTLYLRYISGFSKKNKRG